MARQQEAGLHYFPFDVTFFKDRKIRRLYSKFGADGIVVYLYIICAAYEEEGYFLKADEYLCEDIGFELNMSEEKIGQIINYLCRRSLLDGTLLTSVKVLTSRGIQERFQKAIKTKALKTVREVDSKYWLLEKEETEGYIKVTQNPDNSEKKDDSSEKNPDNSEKKDTNKIKVNEMKLNNKKKVEERKSDSSATECLKTYERYIGLITPAVAEGISFYLSKGMEAETVQRIIEYSAEQNKRTWAYINKVLLGNLSDGVKTLEEYKKAQAGFAMRRTSGKQFRDKSKAGTYDFAELEKKAFQKNMKEVEGK